MMPPPLWRTGLVVGHSRRWRIRGLTLVAVALLALGSVTAPRWSNYPKSVATGSQAPIVALSAFARARTLVVTLADSGETRILYRGDRLVVRLGGPSFYTWTTPTSSRPLLLRRLSGSPGRIGAARFVARSLGRAVVSAVDNPNCYPQCLPPSRDFTLRVDPSLASILRIPRGLCK